MVHYWPRINMAFSLDGVNPLKYVEEIESGGVPSYQLPLDDRVIAQVDTTTVNFYFAGIQDNCTGIDLLLGEMLQRHSTILSIFLTQSSPPSSTPGSASAYLIGGTQLSINTCSCQLLLAIALAARGAYQTSCQGMADMVAKDLQEQAFRLAYARVGELFFAPDDDSIVFLILGAHLLMSEAYPVGALKLIQTAGDRLGRCGRR